jgi:hypothetical protein
MNKGHKMIVGSAALLLGVSLCVPSSFAAKQLSDEEMDQATAKGQSHVAVGNFVLQTITDVSEARVLAGTDTQRETTAGNLINVAGENNVAAGANAAVSSGSDITQENLVDQSKGATVESLDSSATLDDDGITISTTDTIRDNVIAADRIALGDEEAIQDILDATIYEVDLSSGAQAEATGLNIINAAGRNNVAAVWNIASSTGGDVLLNNVLGGAGTGGAISQSNVVNQFN